MNYRSVADLAGLIRTRLHLVPEDIDLVVGVPRSGTLAASLIALEKNVDLCDLEAFVHDLPVGRGRTRRVKGSPLATAREARRVLLVDDSVDSGESLRAALRRLDPARGVARVQTLAAYATTQGSAAVDVHLEVLEQPRVFEWNLMHRALLSECCVDIDGVLCPDPTPAENDDGPAYRRFLVSTPALVVPSYRIGALVTSRLEKYRGPTVDWLERHGIEYEALHMLDLPDAATRQRLRCHAQFKASVYREHRHTRLFVESDSEQARDIARLSGKPCLDYAAQSMRRPGLTLPAVTRSLERLYARVLRKAVRAVRSVR